MIVGLRNQQSSLNSLAWVLFSAGMYLVFVDLLSEPVGGFVGSSFSHLDELGRLFKKGLSETPRFRIPLLLPPYCYNICSGCSECSVTGCQISSGSSSRLPATSFHFSSNTITQWLPCIQCQEVAAAYDRLKFWCLWDLLGSMSGNLTSLGRNRNFIVLSASQSPM